MSPSDTEEEHVAPSRSAPNLPPSTQYDLDRDAGFVHLEKQDLYDERATQRILARSKIIGENRAADNAIVEEVTMINFMCHDKLHVHLGPLINFIVGENGSGKSATLTAITICLGAKASSTNRGGSLKSFIKEGREQATLIVKLKNQGTDAYKPDIFGAAIIIERHFSKTGTSGFKIKSGQGRLISTKKADVDDMMEYFQMQVDNPMSVLSQDAAKKFLNSATPSEKYRMFLKGVQLEQLDNDYRLVAETADAMTTKIDDSKERLKSLKKSVDRAQAQVDTVNKNKNLRNTQQSLMHQLAWGQVEAEEMDLKNHQQLVEEAQRNVDKAEQDVEEKDQAYQACNEAAERADAATRQVVDDMAPLREQELEAKNEYDAANQELANIHREHRQIRDHLTVAKDKVKKIEDDILTEMQRIENANGGGHAQKVSDLTAAQELASQARIKLAEKSDDSHLQELHQKASRDVNSARQPLEAKQQEIANCESRLSSISRDVGQQMAGFDPKIPRLLNMIRDDRGFREKPVGPMGLHIRLLKPIWSNALERSIGNQLNGFVVTSKADQQRLSGMMRQLNLDWCPIIIGNNHPIDLHGHEPGEEFDTVLRVLHIDNELIRRQLIINQGIEQTILIEDRQTAMRVMYDGPRPRNVKQCFCLHDSRRGWGIRLGYAGGSADASSSPIAPPEGKPRMKTDVESQLAYQTETLKQLKQDENILESKCRELRHAMQRQEQALKQHKRVKRDAELELQRAEDAIERLQEALDKDNVEDGHLEALKEDLVEAQGEMKQHEGSYVQAALAKEKQNALSLAQKRALDAVKARIADHEALIKKAEGKARRAHQARQIALQAKNSAIDSLEELKTAKLKAENLRDKTAAIVAEFTAEARKVCPHRVLLEPGMTIKKLEKQYQDLLDLMEKHKKRQGGSDDEIYKRFHQAQATYDTAERQTQGLEDLLNLLKESYCLRLEKWRSFQGHVSASARMQFTYLLSERGFRGKLSLDHKQKTLTIMVEPDETKTSGAGRATTTLSGGEKSFSSICMLMSVWEAMGSPLRCLDEFDVYMDQVNRDITTNLIVGAARRSVGRQFIIISPNALGADVDHGPDVKIIRLVDPRSLLSFTRSHSLPRLERIDANNSIQNV